MDSSFRCAREIGARCARITYQRYDSGLVVGVMLRSHTRARESVPRITGWGPADPAACDRVTTHGTPPGSALTEIIELCVVKSRNL